MVRTQQHTLDQLLFMIEGRNNWKFEPFYGSYSGYTSDDPNTRLTIIHYGIPNGCSKNEYAHRLHNKIRNMILFNLDVTGRHHEILISARQNRELVSQYCCQDERLKNLYREIHKDLRGTRPILI